MTTDTQGAGQASWDEPSLLDLLPSGAGDAGGAGRGRLENVLPATVVRDAQAPAKSKFLGLFGRGKS
jgi:hypothetical protein